MFRRSIKYMLRTPITTTIFIILFLTSTILLVTGANAWGELSKTAKKYEEVFQTVGVISQKPREIKQVERWDGFRQRYIQLKEKNYEPFLNVENVKKTYSNYIVQPYHRPFFGAYMPRYDLLGSDAMGNRERFNKNYVCEVTPIEDCTLDTVAMFEVVDVLYGYQSIKGSQISITGDNLERQEFFEKGTHYMMCLQETYLYDDQTGDVSDRLVFSPLGSGISTQYIDGSSHSTSDKQFYDQVKGDFYGSEKEAKWKEIIKALEMHEYTLPVTPTDATKVLIPFHSKKAYISKGEDITEEEYNDGSKVCLVSETFAKRNNLNIGDTIKIPLYYANYKTIPSRLFTNGSWVYEHGLINNAGKAYEIFSEGEYKIKGLYASVGGNDFRFNMADNEIVVPRKSIHESDYNNIAIYGPMKDGNTTFQIVNGESNTFIEKWEVSGNDELEFEFFDNGYMEVQTSIERIQKIAAIFLVTGIFLSVGLLLLFCNIYIVKQKERSFVERVHGMSRRECIHSLISGFLLVAMITIIIGTMLGNITSKKMLQTNVENEYYSSAYSNRDKEDEVVIEKASASKVGSIVGFGMGVITIVIVYSMAGLVVKKQVIKMR